MDKDWVRMLFRTIVGILVLIQTWQIKTIIDVTQKVAVIQSNRFTSKDANTLLGKVYDKMEELNRGIHELRLELAQIPNEVPPAWFKEIVYDNRKKIELLEQKIQGG